MATFGVTPEGFVRKSFEAILSESLARARAAFGDDVDLSATSALCKILEVTAAEDDLLWRRLEDLHYSRFLSSATGEDLDLLGETVGVARRFLFSRGEVTIKVVNPQPDRAYTLPEGTVVVTGDSPPRGFHTLKAVALSTDTISGTVGVEAFTPGLEDTPANTITGIDPVFAQLYLSVIAPTTFTVTNDQPLTGGKEREPDTTYRARLLDHPRAIWTVDSVRSAAREVPGVLDVLVSDPLGGVDVSQSYFNLFDFGERRFSSERRLGQPYFFEVVVAHEPVRPWRTQGAVTGVYDSVKAAVDQVRPVAIHPSIIEADHIEVGLRAQVTVQPGYDTQALNAAFLDQIASDVGGLKLGGHVLYSHMMRALVEQPGVIDVQNLHLRRCPPAFGRVTFGGVLFQEGVLEAGPGENLVMGPREIAVFRLDSSLIDLAVAPR
jgi:uncharacterized phage protein gp47/JayE